MAEKIIELEHYTMVYYCDSYSKDYNIITIERPNVIEFYLEKKGFGNLFFMAGRGKSSNSMGCINNFIDECIELAENQKFWG